jgi:hypothetical protein
MAQSIAAFVHALRPSFLIDAPHNPKQTKTRRPANQKLSSSLKPPSASKSSSLASFAVLDPKERKKNKIQIK